MRLFRIIRETQISKTQCIEICKSNNPAEGGGFNTPQLCCGISFQSLLWGFIPLILVINTLLLLFVNCKTPFTALKKIEIIEITVFDYGKISLPYVQKDYVSKTLKIKKKHLSTSIYYYIEEKLIDIPINDKYFNHEYFSNFDYNPTKKAKLYVQKYTYEGKEYFVAVKIE